MSFNIVLLEPEIPNNTGNIGRLSIASNCRLHLIEPLGFEIDDKRVKRAGLDYWKHIDLTIHSSFESFLVKENPHQLAFFSSHGQKSYWDIPYQKHIYLIFGKESTGLPENIKSDYNDYLYQIPIDTKYVRSLNLANAVSVVIYEGLRQLSHSS